VRRRKKPSDRKCSRCRRVGRPVPGDLFELGPRIAWDGCRTTTAVDSPLCSSCAATPAGSPPAPAAPYRPRREGER
jgi:hypothetical protein